MTLKRQVRHAAGLTGFKKHARAMPGAVISRAALQVKQRMTVARKISTKSELFERTSPRFVRKEHILRLLSLAAAVFGVERKIIGEDVVPF